LLSEHLDVMLASFLDSSHQFFPQLFFRQEFLCGVLCPDGFQRKGLDRFVD